MAYPSHARLKHVSHAFRHYTPVKSCQAHLTQHAITLRVASVSISMYPERLTGQMHWHRNPSLLQVHTPYICIILHTFRPACLTLIHHSATFVASIRFIPLAALPVVPATARYIHVAQPSLMLHPLSPICHVVPNISYHNMNILCRPPTYVIKY